jgi:hypothetical protein
LVAKQGIDVRERSTKLVGKNLEFTIVSNHGDDVLLEHCPALAGEPDDAQDATHGIGGWLIVGTALLLGCDKLLSKIQRQAQNLEEHRGQEGIVILDSFGQLAEKLLVNLGGRHAVQHRVSRG